MEAPGTAPGSEWLITKAIYRHSRLAPTRIDISLYCGKKKDCSSPIPKERFGVSGARHLGGAVALGLVAAELDDGAAARVDFHLDLVAGRVLAFDLPDAIVELDLLELHDALGEGHVAHLLDADRVGQGR